MPFKKVGPGKYKLPSGRTFNTAQVKLYYAKGGHFPGNPGMKEMNSNPGVGKMSSGPVSYSGSADETSSRPTRSSGQSFGPLKSRY